MIRTNIPHLAGDEGILAEIPNIDVKSIQFRLFLTNKRLILTEDAGRNNAPVIVPLQVIRNISSGTNFSDDPTLKLSLCAPDGSQKKMVLSFTQEFAGIRDKERDQLKKILQGVVSECQMTVRSAPKPFPSGYSDNQGGFFHSGDISGSAGYESAGPQGSAGQYPGGPILTAANVVVKSQEYTATLTNEKITLTDPNRPHKPSDIPLAAVRSAEGESGDQGEPAIGLLVESGNGNIRRMVLKFSQWYNKNRWGERETWVRAIQDILATGSVGEIYVPTAADMAPQASKVPAAGGFSARPPGMQEDSVFCPNCGNTITPGAKFCGFCGYSVPSSYSGGIIDSEPNGDDSGGYMDDDMFAPASSGRQTRKKAKSPKRSGRRKPEDDGLFGGGSRKPLFEENSALGRVFGMITSPADIYQRTKGQDAVDSVPSLAISLLIFAIGNIIFLSWFASSLNSAEYPVMSTFSDIGTAIFFVFEMVIIILIIIVIYGILLHISVGLMGYRSEINDGIRVSIYSATAFIAGGVVPVIGLFIIPFWAFLLQVIGLRDTYNLSGMQALISALIPAFVIFLGFYFFIISGGSNFSIFGGA